MYSLFVARQRLSKNVTSAMNTRATIEELLDVSFSMWSVTYKRKVGDLFFPELLIYQNIGSDLPNDVARKRCY
jgi:hypothetical protein